MVITGSIQQVLVVEVIMVKGKLNKVPAYDESELMSVNPSDYPETLGVIEAMFINHLRESSKKAANKEYSTIDVDGFRDGVGTYYFRIGICTHKPSYFGVNYGWDSNCPPAEWYRYDPNSSLYRFNWENIGIIVGSAAMIGAVIYSIRK